MSKKPKKPKKSNIHVRRSWGDLDPKTRVHKSDKDYNRKKNKEVVFDSLEDEAEVDPFGTDWNEDGEQE